MLKKFSEGLVFGGGFAISFAAIWYVAIYYISPIYIGAQPKLVDNHNLPDTRATILPNSSSRHVPVIRFHELNLEEQIKKSSVIALARYEPSTDGKMKAVIKEFLKKESSATFYYNLGDEHPSSSYYPKKGTSHGDGIVMFFTGSPATMKMSMTYHGDRIRGLGDLPIELLRKKCSK